jgi:nitrogen regulatory protein PII
MEPLQKIEIILSAAELPRLKRLAEQQGMHYSVFHHVTGAGDRGVRDDDEVTGVFTNVCFMSAVPAGRVEAFVEKIRPMLKKSGGLCLVSDTRGLSH